MPNILETYKKRTGILDHGKEFEYLMCAFYSLKLIDCEEITDFEIFTNHEAGENFDDVILRVKFFDDSVKIILLQLKHSKSKSLTLNALISENGEFSLIKYQKSYSKIKLDNFKSTCDANKFDVYMILYTNRFGAFGNNSKLTLQTQECQIKKNKTDQIQNLLNTNETGDCVYKIEISTSNSSIDFKNFFKHFRIYTDQKNYQNIKNDIHKLLQKKLSCDVGNAFINFFKKWWEGNFMFNKKDVIVKLSELVFSPSIITLSDEKFNENSKLLKEAITLFDVTILEGRVDGDIDEKIWNEPLHQHFDESTVAKTIQKFALTDRNISANTHLTPKEINKSLWYLDELPFVIEINKSNKNQIQSAILFLEQHGIKKKLLLKGDCQNINLPNSWKVLKNVFDVKKEKEELYQSIIEQFEVSFENEEIISLENLFANDEENAKFLDLSGLLYILSTSDLPCIKRKKEDLPLEYIPRAVTSVFLDIEKLLKQSIFRETFFIINCNDKINPITNIIPQRNVNIIEFSRHLQLEDSKLSMEETFIIAEQEECTLQQYWEICLKDKENVHLLKVIDEECFMLIASHGNRERLKYFTLSKPLNIKETSIHRVFNGPLNFISTEPGMGKSTTMKYLKNETPSDYWPIFIELRNYNSIFKGEVVAENILKTFLNSEDEITNSFLRKIKQIFVRKKKVIFFLDGLDEMDHDCIDKAIKCFKEICLRGFRLWVSTREHLQEKLEEQLNIFPVQIVELNESQQERYINIRLKGKYENDEIKKIVEKISTSVSISNNNKFLGIPLQLYITTEILINNKPSNLEIDEKMFVLTNLYKTYFKGIIKHTLKKKGLTDEDLAERTSMSEFDRYTVPALKVCLSDDHFQRLNLDLRQSDEFLLLIKEKGDSYGIIKQLDTNGKATYGHQTYVEYFACYFLSRNFDKVQQIKQELFYDKYTNLRLFLDLELAKESPLHLGIIYGNVEFLEECVEKFQINKDQGNRSPLHLICSYVNRYQRLEKIGVGDTSLSYEDFKSYYSYVEPGFLPEKENPSLQHIVMKLVELCSIMKKDKLYQWNPVEYALVSGSLLPIEAMLQKRNEILNFVLEAFDEATLLYYAARLAYHNLLRAMLKKNPFLMEEIKYKLALKDKVYLDTSILHVAVMFVNEKVENIQTLEILLSFVDNINTLQTWHGETILHIASIKGDCELISYLLKYDIDLNLRDSQGRTSLFLAASYKNNDVVKLLIEKGAKVNCITNYGQSILHAASDIKNCELISCLLNYDINLNQKDIYGQTALFLAASYRNNDVVKLLIEKGAKVNDITKRDQSVLHVACVSGNCEFISYLLNYDIDLNQKDIYGQTALFLAASYRNNDVVKLLIEKGAKVNDITNRHESVLHVACVNGNCEFISFLLNYDINLSQKDIYGETALSVAKFYRNDDVVKLLIQKGADMEDEKTVLRKGCERRPFYSPYYHKRKF